MTGLSGSETLIPSSATHRATWLCRVACADQAECASETFQHSQRDVRRDRLVENETKRKPVLGYIGDASMDRVRICVQRDAAAVKRDRAPIGGFMPNSDNANSVRPDPSNPVRPTTSPARNCRLTSS